MRCTSLVKLTKVVALLVACCTGTATAYADPDALWRIVHDACVPNEQQHGDPAPCASVDLDGRADRGYAVFKDAVGANQYLLIPTSPITGIESPELLAPEATNYFAAAWRARSFIEQQAGATLPRDWVSLAVNPPESRSQNQLHIHIDCVRADVHALLSLYGDRVGFDWAPFPVPLAGHTYQAVAVQGADLTAVNPFLLASRMASDDGRPAPVMSRLTLVVTGASDIRGQPGFVILANHGGNQTDGPLDATASGEELQNHEACPPLQPTNVTSK